jgi:hypothetical protein
MAYFEFDDVETALEYMVKTPYGWRHTYIPKETDDGR